MPNQPRPDLTRLEIGLPKDLKAAAQAAAKRNNESVSEAVRRFLTEYAKGEK